jgi:F-type H+-transporting ATPase subunit gamma
MQSLKDIKIKIQSYKKTGAVTRAMEAVSAVKMRKSQQRSLVSRPYAEAAQEILERISEQTTWGTHHLMRAHEGKTCIIVVTSDKGLAGPLNNAVIKRVEKEIAERKLAKDDVIIVAMGRRGGDHFSSRGYDVREKYENLSDDVLESDMRAITDKVLAGHESGDFGTAFMVYTHFVNTFEQKPEFRQIVPIVRPAHAASAYTIEPEPEEVLHALLPKLLNIAVFHGLLESKASEHSARMVAMKSATDKARDMAAAYTRSFNKARQAAITREVSEIVGGIEAMR